jgi:hypothetical protein
MGRSSVERLAVALPLPAALIPVAGVLFFRKECNSTPSVMIGDSIRRIGVVSPEKT